MPAVQQIFTGTDAQLRELLDANLQLPPEYQAHLTNHLPMALHSLHSLGASPQRMRDFYAAYVRRFSIQHQPDVSGESLVPVSDWRHLRGRSDAYPTLLTHFNHLVASSGAGNVLKLVLPDLLPGVAAAAFHGVIRTAHAVQAAHAGELAAALAYWAWRWQPLKAPPVVDPLLRFDRWASRLVELAPAWRGKGQRISIRMDEASQSDIYWVLAGALMPATTIEQRIADLAALAVDRYVAQPNFTVLHMITGLRALRALLPWMQDAKALQTIVVQCFVAAYLAAGLTPLDPAIIPRTKSWSEVIESALASDDDHVIKLVHVCLDEAAAYGEGRYLLAATLATGS